MNRATCIRAGLIVLAVLALPGCEQRVVSARGIGTEKYIVEPDPAPRPTSRQKRFVPPRTTNPASKLGRTSPY